MFKDYNDDMTQVEFAAHNIETGIEIEIVKPFEACRTPCPPKGHRGTLVGFDGDFLCVQIMKPFVCTHNYKWLWFDDDPCMILKFKEDEIKMIEDKACNLTTQPL